MTVLKSETKHLHNFNIQKHGDFDHLESCFELQHTHTSFIRLAADNLVGDGSGQRVEEQGEKQRCDQQNDADDDVLLVASPHQVKETFERVNKPREGGVWTTVEKRGEKQKNWFSSLQILTDDYDALATMNGSPGKVFNVTTLKIWCIQMMCFIN